VDRRRSRLPRRARRAAPPQPVHALLQDSGGACGCATDPRARPSPQVGDSRAAGRCNPAAAFANIARALRAGPLTLLVWQAPTANDWFLELTGILAAGRQLPTPARGAPGPFSLADPGRCARFVTGLGAFAALLGTSNLTAATRRSRSSMTACGHWSSEGVQYPSAMWLITATRQ
jgi:hypothetical protein